MLERFRAFRAELNVRLKHASVSISRKDWEAIQSGIFDLNGAAVIGQSLAQNTVAAAYAPEIAIGNVMSVAVFGQEALRRINDILDELEIAGFMEVRKGSDNQYGLFPKPQYRGRVSIRETVDEKGVLQNVRIDLKRRL